MMDAEEADLTRRLAPLEPFLRELGQRTLQTYEHAGILDAIPGTVYPVADALFTRDGETLTFHPHGAVYLNVTTGGDLQLALPSGAVPLQEGIIKYLQLAHEPDLEDARPAEGATEWFPPPRFVLVAETSRLYIASAGSIVRAKNTTGLVPLEQYVSERAQLFVEGFRAAI
ncbi:hypothetical protein [Pseudarthrobacter sp. DSP2-3-2b1]|uniref:hypothetical protein n=1 Tax=Pseudarthrobacter sp. DSP2-3-2b1 TaxID=2804661 RepID=UPI003CF58575